MFFRDRKKVLLFLALAGMFGTASVSHAQESSRSSERNKGKGSRDSAKVEIKYPDSTRPEPKAKGAAKAQASLQKLIAANNKEDYPSAREQADAMLANPAAADYDRALAAQIGSIAAYNLDDTPATIAYLKQAIEINALENNAHFQLMHMLASLQLQEEQYPEGLATLDRYFAETNSKAPDDIALKGQGLYQAERYAEAVPLLKQAIETSPEPKDNWRNLLMASYIELGQTVQAMQMAEAAAAKAPDDKRVQLNLASTYLQADKYDRAAAVLEKLRSAGQLTEERDYRLLYSTYANIDNREKDVIGVINDGLQKGILKPDRDTYVALAQSYYYSDQMPQAIEAWQKAAPLAKDGEVYLNLATALWQEDRLPEAKQAAKQALDKGVKRPETARKILAQP